MPIKPFFRILVGALTLACATGHAAEPEWLPFQWVRASLTGGAPERLGMLLPVTVNGAACTVQLDTGANGDWNWKRGGRVAATAAAAAAENGRAQVALAGRRLAIPASAANLAQIQGGDCGIDPIAIVGNALFENGTLTLDLGRERYAYTPKPLLDGVAGAHPLFYVSWSEGGGHILVEVKRAGARDGYAMLDTGAARFGLVANDEREWRELTGGAPLPFDAPDVLRIPGPVGEAVVCGEMTLKDAIEVAGKRLTPRAGYCKGHSFKAPVRMLGVLGMASLGERTLTLDYLSRRWTLSD